MAWDKNPSDVAPATYSDIMNYAYVAPTKSNISVALNLPASDWKLISSTEPTKFNHGALVLATEGQTSLNAALGKALVHYTIQFRTA